MNRETLLRHVGNMQQLAYVRPVKWQQGRAGGMNGMEVKNGSMQFLVMTDKCLDIAELSYKGWNLNFLSKPGLAGRNHYDTNGEEALRSIMGGMLFTCGLENIGAPCRIEGKDYPMHGRIRTTPAEHISSTASWRGDNYCLEISGEMREAELFGENLLLQRTIRTEYLSKTIHICDVVRNEGFRREPLMLLYHFNLGYPLLSEDCELIIPTRKVTARDKAAMGHEQNFNRMEAPLDNEPEYVFFHETAEDENGYSFGAIINEALGIGLKISYDKKNLPYFMQWKSIASGDYVIGLEPANSSVLGKAYHLKEDSLPVMEPGEERQMNLTLTLMDTSEEFQQLREEAKRLVK